MAIKALVENPGADPQHAWAMGTIPTARRVELIGDHVLFHVRHPSGMVDAGIVGRAGPVATELWVRGVFAGAGRTVLDVVPVGGPTHPVWVDLVDGTNPEWVASRLIDRAKIAGMFPSAHAGGVELVRAESIALERCSKAEQCFLLTGRRGGWSIRCWLMLALNSPQVRFAGAAWWSDPTTPAHDVAAERLEVRFPALDLTCASLSFDESHAGALAYDSVSASDGAGFPFSGTIDWSGESERTRPGGAGTLVAAFYEDEIRPSRSVWQHHLPGKIRLIDVDPVAIAAGGYAGAPGAPAGRRTTLEYRDNTNYGQKIGSGDTGDRSVFGFPAAEILLGASSTALRACRYGAYSEAFRPIWRTEADGSPVRKAAHPGWLVYLQSSWVWGSDFLGKSDPGGSKLPTNVWGDHDWGHRCNFHVATYYLLTHDRLAEEVMRRNLELLLASVDYWLGGRYLGRPIKHIAEIAYCLPDTRDAVKQFLRQWLARNERDHLTNWTSRGVNPAGRVKPYRVARRDPRNGLNESPFPGSFVPWQDALWGKGLWVAKQGIGWDFVTESYWTHVGEVLRTGLLGEGFARDPVNPTAWLGCHACSYADGEPVVVNDVVSDPRTWVAAGQGPLETSIAGLVMLDDLDRSGRISLSSSERAKLGAIVAWAGTRDDLASVRRWRAAWEAERVI